MKQQEERILLKQKEAALESSVVSKGTKDLIEKKRMLTHKLRPKNLEEMVGNALNKEILRAIAKHPKESPSNNH